MNLDLKTIATGALAGLTSALLVLAAVSHLSASTLFLILASMPVFIAGLGFGVQAAVAALVSSFIVLSFAQSPLFALSIFALPQLPAAWMSRLANMARPAEELGGPKDVMAWFPLSDMLNQLCTISAIVISISLFVTGYGQETASAIVNAALKAMTEQDPSLAYDSGILMQVAALYYYLLPLNQAVSSVIIIFAAYYFSAIIVRMATKGLRPREDMPSALRMPLNGIYAFGTGLALLLLGAAVQNNALIIVGASVAGAFGAGFLLGGLATFHQYSRGKSWRMPALILVYLTISITGIIFLVTGLINTRRTIALTPAPKDKSEKQ